MTKTIDDSVVLLVKKENC